MFSLSTSSSELGSKFRVAWKKKRVSRRRVWLYMVKKKEMERTLFWGPFFISIFKRCWWLGLSLNQNWKKPPATGFNWDPSCVSSAGLELSSAWSCWDALASWVGQGVPRLWEQPVWYVAQVQVKYCNISWEDCKTSFQRTCFITKVNSTSPSGFSTDICY